jgi:tRNA A37 threonylcarbamoyladenosine biosynthesis protein TsaE
MVYRSFSSARTRQLGRTLAAALILRGPRQRVATVVALSGELGSGKTTFVQGFLRGLGSRARATSPTFILFRRHALAAQQSSSASIRAHPPIRVNLRYFTSAIHADAYRLRSPRDLAALGFALLLKDPANVIIVEWANRVRKILPKQTAWVTFHHGQRPHERTIECRGKLMATKNEFVISANSSNVSVDSSM